MVGEGSSHVRLHSPVSRTQKASPFNPWRRLGVSYPEPQSQWPLYAAIMMIKLKAFSALPTVLQSGLGCARLQVTTCMVSRYLSLNPGIKDSLDR